MPKKSTPYEVGQEIETKCTKCKTETVHAITVLKDDVVKKVICKACLTTHVYRDSSASATASKPGRPRQAASGTTVRRGRKSDWPTLVSKIEESEIVDYSISEDFSQLKAIRHKKFGIGVITKIIADNKIEVVFEDNKKVLVQNWIET